MRGAFDLGRGLVTTHRMSCELWRQFWQAVDAEINGLVAKDISRKRITLVMCQRFPGSIHVAVDGQRKRAVTIRDNPFTHELEIFREDW